MKDLSTQHAFVGDVFERPTRAAEWSRYRLSDKQVEFYREHGYLAGVRMLNDEQVEVLRDEVATLVDPKHPGNHL